MTEYSYPLAQTVAASSNLIFLNGDRCCKKNLITHNDNSGVFRIKAAGNCCKTIFRVKFNGNIAIATDGTVGEIGVAFAQNSETLNNAVAIVTPAAVGELWNVSLETFIELPCGCCDTLSIKNVSGTAITVENANIIIDRVA